MTSLVTGASGFIGSHLVHKIANDDEIPVSVVHDCKMHTNKWLHKALISSIRVRGDIRDLQFLKRVLNQYDVEYVYHLAAQSIVKRAWKDPVSTFDVNVMGTVYLLEACRQLDVENILIQITDKVYGNQMGAKTTSVLLPTEIYGTSKICTDYAARAFIETYGMNIAIVRMCNVYGYDWNNRIIPNTIRACLCGESPIIFVGDNSKRQYIYIEDAVSSLRLLIGKTGIFNVGTPDILTQEEVVLEILTNFPSLKPKYVPKTKIKEIRSQSIDIMEFPAYRVTTFAEGIKLTIEKFKEFGI